MSRYVSSRLPLYLSRNRRREADLQAVLESMEEIFFSFDVKRRKVLQLSAACESVFGYPAEAFEKDPELWYRQVFDEDKIKVQRCFKKLWLGQNFKCEYRITTRSGETRWLETKIKPSINRSRKLYRLDGISADITERKQMEERLRTAKRHLVSSQQIGRIGSWEVRVPEEGEPSSHVYFWSDETYRIFGYEPGEVQPTYDLVRQHQHPDDVERVIEAMSASVRDRRPFEMENRIVRKDGQVVNIKSRAQWFAEPHGARGRLTMMMGTVQDVTEQKQAEEGLRAAEANLRNIFENTDTAYILLDPETTILAYNRVAAELSSLLGLKLEKGACYLDLVLESRKDAAQEGIALVLAKREKISYEVQVKSVMGEDLWLSVSMHPILNGNKVLGLSVASRNITVKKTAEQKIQASNERYQLVLEATNDLIWDWHIETDKMYRSDNYSRLLAKRTGENSGGDSYWTENIHEEDLDRVAKSIFESLSDPQVRMWESEYRFRPGNSPDPVYVKDKGLILRNELGQAIRMVGAMRDITSEKLLQIERDKITVDLVHRNKDLEQFAYIVSHNLRAPVANILGIVDLLKKYNDPETFQECLNGLFVSVGLLNNVILDLNHILQVRQEVSERREKVSLQELLADIKASISTLIERDNAVIASDFSEAAEFVCMKSYLHSIFHNLIINSIKYKKACEPPLLEIFSKRRGNSLFLHFRDNGLGIDMKRNGSKIFGLYKRFHLHTEGKGLGLFMVKTQVEVLGGKIDVKSEPDKGTEFIIELPDVPES